MSLYNTNTLPILYIVVPCYNEEAILYQTYNALTDKMLRMVEDKCISPKSAIVFVDDGSRDATWDILKNFATNNLSMQSDKLPKNTQSNSYSNKASSLLNPQSLEHSSILDSHKSLDSDINKSNINKTAILTISIKLSKNVGHQNALLAGLEFASNTCDCAISIDCDLQDDITILDTFVNKFKEGNEIVYGVRKSRNKDTKFKKYTALGFYRIMELMGVKIIYNHADYRLLSARALHALLKFKEVNLFLRGIVPLIGYKSSTVEYDRLERKLGESKYPLSKMLSFAWNGITSFSIMPLRLVSMLGILFFVVSLLLIIYATYIKLFTTQAIYGWASTIIPLCFFSGIQLLSLGIIGEYIGKIYQEIKRRPRYFIEEIANNDSNE